MKIIRVTYFALATLLSAASCSKEAAESEIDWSSGEIYFRPSLSDVATSRAEDMTLDHLEAFQVTCFNTGDINKDAAGFIIPYFEDATFIRRSIPASVTYISSPAEGPRDWPAGGGLLKFLAFSPSRAVMANNNSAITDANRSQYFNLINTSIEINSTTAVGYRLGTVRVNPDISRQFDFVTAEASGERWKDFNNGVELAFHHQMSQVELKAWGSGIAYNFDIAGVRLGNPVVEDVFIFSDTDTPSASGSWKTDIQAVNDKVEYLYRGNTADGQLPASGDRIFHITHTEHNTVESAESIMGQGGCAMVIPTVNPKWEGLADPNIAMQPYATNKMYFSILLRVTDAASGYKIYPYPDKPYEMTVIHYAVDRSGQIITRLYPGLTEGTFFTDPELQQPYVATEGVEIQDFGWAAVPVDVDWDAGKRYVYTLNYSEGIGVHDPDDPEPGKPIVGKSTISWGVSVDRWEYATKNEDYDPDVIVP